MHLHRSLLLPEMRPGKDGETEINGGGVQGVYGGIEIDAKRVGRIHRPGYMNQGLRKVGVDPPIAALIGIRQSRTRDAPAKSEMVKLLRHGREAGFYVTKTLAKR